MKETSGKHAALPPIVRSVSVSWAPEEAFRRFTEGFADWWPRHTHSIGKERVERIVFECRAGGLIYEQHRDGRRFQWGEVREWEPPRRVRFTWHPSRDKETAQDVELTFHPQGGGTRLELVASGWERWGKGAPTARRGYDLGWAGVLNVFAGRRTLGMRVLDGLAALIGLVRRLGGGTESAIARAGGELKEGAPSA
jgi:uncharacterized protein YndB with AHSA1/START domain